MVVVYEHSFRRFVFKMKLGEIDYIATTSDAQTFLGADVCL